MENVVSFRTQANIYDGAFLQKIVKNFYSLTIIAKKGFVVDVRLDSKYAFDSRKIISVHD